MTPGLGAVTPIHTTWDVLQIALAQRRAVRLRYQDRLRVICPHALGWKNGRPKALVYQTAIIGAVSTHDPRGWRSLFVDEMADLSITDDPWQTPRNYTPLSSGIDILSAALP